MDWIKGVSKLRRSISKCNHDVHSYEWEKCSRCGKYVRVNLLNEFLTFLITMFTYAFVADPFADWGIRALRLSEYNPRNITHAILGCIPVSLVYYFIIRKIPDYDEKDQL